MPCYKNDSYKPPLIFRNNHIHTIIPSLFRRVKLTKFQQIRIETPDNDFIDVDYYKASYHKLVIITHGLEGNSRKAYVLGTIKLLMQYGFDALAINFRGCSGVDNNLFTSYHAGKTDDLEIVVNYAIKKLKYPEIVLVGYSIGGNITLKYVGESGIHIAPEIKGAVAISVPCNLESSSMQLSHKSNFLYLFKFMRSLKRKAVYKIKNYDNLSLSITEIKNTTNFLEFDNLFTAPVHGFKNARDYWSKCSCRKFLSSIKIPSLLINSLDDPFLTRECFPYREAENNPFFHFITTNYGGHVGFINDLCMKRPFFHEEHIARFCNNLFDKSIPIS